MHTNYKTMYRCTRIVTKSSAHDDDTIPVVVCTIPVVVCTIHVVDEIVVRFNVAFNVCCLYSHTV